MAICQSEDNRTWILHSGCERHQDRQKAKSDIPLLANQGVEVRMVAVYRDLEASTASIRRHIERSYRRKYKYTPCQIAEAWQAGFERRLVEFPNQNNLYRVCYERLVDNPRVEIMRLIRFCYEDLPIRWNDNVDQVAEWVTPSLKHF
ncbi:MAG: hypothetical protein ACW99G_17100 [Candidatus Thorarchaeota archaeon]|jgi:hypothetical protein